MDLLTGDILSKGWTIISGIGVIYGAIKALQAFKGGVTSGLALTRRQQLADLRRRRDFLIRLNGSDRAYYGWLLSGILWALVVLGAQLMIEGGMSPFLLDLPQDQQAADMIRHGGRFGAGMILYAIALNRVVRHGWLQHFDHSLATFDRRIATLEAKMSQHAVPVHGAT